MKFLALLLTAATALLAGCASTPESSTEADEYAKRFQPQRGVAVIYLYRDDRFQPQTGVTATIDGRLLGEVLPTTYFRMTAYPGTHVISTIGANAARIEFETEPGVIYFVQMTAVGADSPFVRLLQVPPERGEREIISCCDRMENWRRGQQRLLF